MRPFHLVSYFEALAAGDTNADVNGVTDGEVTLRNNHPIFTEPYNVIAAYVNAASITAARLNVPTINGVARHHFWPLQRSATIPDQPFVMDYRDRPIQLPQNEEIALEVSNNLGAATEDTWGHLFVAPPNWNRNIPVGLQRLTVRATYTITSVDSVWSGPGALTFAENLKGGWYSVVGMSFQDANTLAARLIFPRGNVVNGRRLRPGCLSLNALGNRDWPGFLGGMGEWGRFHSFEPPQIEILANNAGAHTAVEVRLDLIYHGDSAAAMPV